MILLIDNYDSFTYNLAQYLQELGREVTVYRNDALGLDAIRRLKPEAIVISPGPGDPDQAGISLEVIRELGGKVPILEGAQLGSVVVPFMPMRAPFTEVKEMIQKLWDVWGENGNNRERIGEFMLRVGVGNFMESIGEAPNPHMVMHPRENPYIFY